MHAPLPLWPGKTLVSCVTESAERRAYILALSPDPKTLKGMS